MDLEAVFMPNCDKKLGQDSLLKDLSCRNQFLPTKILAAKLSQRQVSAVFLHPPD